MTNFLSLMGGCQPTKRRWLAISEGKRPEQKFKDAFPLVDFGEQPKTSPSCVRFPSSFISFF